MIPAPPGFGAIITGISYGLKLAIRQVHPLDSSAHPQDARAVWQALWFRFLVTMFNGALVLGVFQASTLTFFALISIIDTLAFPVVSHAVIARMGNAERFPAFITAFTWVGNLRVLLMMTIVLMAGFMDAHSMQLLIFPFALWMIWASWSVASQTLLGGWKGAGMVILAMIFEMITGFLIITYIHQVLPPGVSPYSG
jgi:hypothetical protein